MTLLSQLDLEESIAGAQSAFHALSGAHLFMTGGTGFFGTWLLETFGHARATLGLDLRVTVLTRQPEAFLSKYPRYRKQNWATLIQGDILDFPFPSGDFSHVIHAATTSAHETYEGQNARRKFDVVALGTRRVLDFCFARHIPELLYIGSGAVYGSCEQDAQLIVESCATAPDTLDPHSTLGHAKRTAELFCAMAAAEGRTSIKLARCFSFVGPLLPLSIHYAVGNFVAAALKGDPITLRGDGTPIRSYLYMSELVRWLVTILVHGAPLRPYNVGSEDGRSLLEIAQLIADSVGVEVRLPEFPAPALPTSAGNRYVPSTQRARTELGLTQSIALEEALHRTIAFYRQAH